MIVIKKMEEDGEQVRVIYRLSWPANKKILGINFKTLIKSMNDCNLMLKDFAIGTEASYYEDFDNEYKLTFVLSGKKYEHYDFMNRILYDEFFDLFREPLKSQEKLYL